MKLRTVIVLAGLGALAARKATATRRRPVALLEPGPPVTPLPAPETVAPEPTAPVDAPEAEGEDTAAADQATAAPPPAQPFTPVPGLHLPASDDGAREEAGEPDATAEEPPLEGGHSLEDEPQSADGQEPAAADAPEPEPEPEQPVDEEREPEPSIVDEATVAHPEPDETEESEREPESEEEAEPAPEPEPTPGDAEDEEAVADGPSEAESEPEIEPEPEPMPGDAEDAEDDAEGPPEAEPEREAAAEAVEVDGWPVPTVPEPVPVADPPPLPRVEDVPTGWSVVLYPGQEAPDDPTAQTRVEPPVAATAAPAVDPAPAAVAQPPASPTGRRVDESDARRLLLGNQVPLVFVGATPFAMLGLDRVVGRLSAISVQDCFDGRHGSVYVARGLPPFTIADPVSAANVLLAESDVIDRLRLRPGRIVALTCDEETERLAEAFGHAVALAPTVMRRRLGAQSELVHLARDAGVHALPAVTGHAGSYQDLLLLARGLGTDLLVESLDRPGQAPAPIGSLEDWSAHERRLGSEHLRVTRRLDGPAYVLAGVAATDRVVVAPVVADARSLPGDPPYGGGTMVSDVAADLEPELLSSLRAAVRSIGSRLAREGFRGMFEVELAVDRRGTAGPTLTAIRPEGSVATLLDTVSATAADELPVLALHLAVQLGAALDTAADDVAVRPPWSFLVIEDASDTLRTVTEAPASGVWCLDRSAHGGVRYVRSETDWRTVGDSDEVFYLRIARAGSVCAPGGALGVVVTPGRLTADSGQPAESAQQWIRGIRRNVWTAAAPAGGETTAVPPGLLAL